MFSPLFLDFINQERPLKQYYSLFPEKGNFQPQLLEKQKQFPEEGRKILVSSLQKQYEGLDISEEIKQNILSLNDSNTFTIVTGHQLNIFTGPLYFIYKIVTVINACKELCDQYPEFNFVPVYWMASEDHDFEEICHIKLFGQKYTWETDQTGAVGRFDPSSLKAVLDSLPGSTEVFEKAYLEHDTLADAVRYYVSEIFGDEGLVVIDGDDRHLKSVFSEVVKEELQNQSSFKEVQKATYQLDELGYKPQISSREINLFYLDQGMRERIVMEDGIYRVLNTKLSFSKDEILKLVDQEPEKFSPNVILRPLYQEMVLPNLAYVGGPAEVVYWLQLKGMFDFFTMPFPILLPRNFVLFLDHVANRKLSKTGIEIAELFDPVNELVEKHVRESSQNELELFPERDSVSKIYEDILKKAATVDVTLEPLVNAESQRVLNSIEKIEKKIIKAEKQHHDQKIRQLEDLKEKLFPGGEPQERSQNFLNFQIQDAEFVNKIKSTLSPFDLKYHVVIDGNK